MRDDRPVPTVHHQPDPSARLEHSRDLGRDAGGVAIFEPELAGHRILAKIREGQVFHRNAALKRDMGRGRRKRRREIDALGLRFRLGNQRTLIEGTLGL